jgi:hypothetical protein
MNIMLKTIGCGVLVLALLSGVQTVGATGMNCPTSGCTGVADDNGHGKPNQPTPVDASITDSTKPDNRPQTLAYPVLPAQAKNVTRFSNGASQLRQQVHMQTQRSNGQ